MTMESFARFLDHSSEGERSAVGAEAGNSFGINLHRWLGPPFLSIRRRPLFWLSVAT